MGARLYLRKANTGDALWAIVTSGALPAQIFLATLEEMEAILAKASRLPDYKPETQPDLNPELVFAKVA